MSGLIILFWFVADAVVLRYFVSIFLILFSAYDRQPFRYYLSALCLVCTSCGTSSVCIFSHTHDRLSHALQDDTIRRKVNNSDASAFAEICGCCPSRGEDPA